VEALLRLADRHHVLDMGRVVWAGGSAALGAAPEVQVRHLGVARAAPPAGRA
jgi:branched-chain amino acid transport system ATP-binding protein